VSSAEESNRHEFLKQKPMDVDELISRIIKSMEKWYKISTDKQSIIRKGTPHPISVNVTRHPRYNRTLTCVSGFETFGLDAESLAKGLNTACASSTMVQRDPRNPELKQIMVQGEHVKAVAERLIARGIQGQWIEVRGNFGNWVGRTRLVDNPARARLSRFRSRRVKKIQTGRRMETLALATNCSGGYLPDN